MVNVRVHAVIPKPHQEVAAYATNPDNDPRWIGGISEVRWLFRPT